MATNVSRLVAMRLWRLAEFSTTSKRRPPRLEACSASCSGASYCHCHTSGLGPCARMAIEEITD